MNQSLFGVKYMKEKNVFQIWASKLPARLIDMKGKKDDSIINFSLCNDFNFVHDHALFSSFPSTNFPF